MGHSLPESGPNPLAMVASSAVVMLPAAAMAAPPTSAAPSVTTPTTPRVFFPGTPPTTPPRGGRGNLSEGQAQLDVIGGNLRVQLRFLSGLTVETGVDRTTRVSELRGGLLRICGGSPYRDEAVIVDATGKLSDDPWATPFSDTSGDGDVYQVFVRKFNGQAYYRDQIDRR